MVATCFIKGLLIRRVYELAVNVTYVTYIKSEEVGVKGAFYFVGTALRLTRKFDFYPEIG